jgi:hypothetical protein
MILRAQNYQFLLIYHTHQYYLRRRTINSMVQIYCLQRKGFFPQRHKSMPKRREPVRCGKNSVERGAADHQKKRVSSRTRIVWVFNPAQLCSRHIQVCGIVGKSCAFKKKIGTGQLLCCGYSMKSHILNILFLKAAAKRLCSTYDKRKT